MGESLKQISGFNKCLINLKKKLEVRKKYKQFNDFA